MTKPTNLINDVYGIEVPSMAFGFDINNYADESELMYMLSMEDIADDANHEETLITKKLPPGTWQLIGTTKGITRAQASKIVEQQGIGWKDYNPGNFHHDLPFMVPLDSLRSLLASKGLDKKNYVLIKKVG